MDLSLLHAAIDTAKQHESETQELAKFLTQRSLDLHHSITIPQYQAPSHLLAFTTRYIEQIPDVLKSTEEISRHVGIELLTQPALKLAMDFLLHPLDVKSARNGLLAFMNNTYVAYRIVEEINDRFMKHCNEPLLPTDFSDLNIIIHHLIGDEFATDLDLAIHAFSEQLEADITHIATRLPKFDRKRHHSLFETFKTWPVFNNVMPNKVMPVSISLNRPKNIDTRH
jgi:hypothetical protein